MDEGQVVRRKVMPNFSAWKLDSLRTECLRLAGRRKALRYGLFAEDVLHSISNAKKDQCITALVERAGYITALGKDAEWKDTPVGITPEKSKKKRTRAHDKKSRKKNSDQSIRKNEAYSCRLAALTVRQPFFDLYMASRSKPSRAETDARKIGKNHIFYKTVAQAMIDPEWEDPDGNKLSVPDDHESDIRAPENLRDALRSLDLKGAAESLLQELEHKWDNEEDFLTTLQECCLKWLKEIRAAHTVSSPARVAV